MKHLSRAIIAVFMAILMATLLPVQVFADTPDYISEVKVAMGSTDSLEGYTILTDGNNKPVDLNRNAGGGTGSKGDKAVYLGYKTTKSRSEAVTDLALMNMKGGYSMAMYEELMNTNMKEQIIPFVENFLATINEYRANYNSKIKANKERAHYFHDLLNKLVDDDTGKGLGDLLLNKTKYEMKDADYNALSDTKKKEHADILTIIAQSNGQATLVMEKLLTRAADTYESSWIERLAQTDYDTLVEETGLSPNKAAKLLAKEYDDDAMTILEKWDELREKLLTYDDALAFVENYQAPDIDDIKKKIEALNDNSSASDLVALRKELSEAENTMMEYNEKSNIVAIHDYLEAIAYTDGTLLDYFTMSPEDIEDDITVLYPMVYAMTAGQRAGLEFLTLEEYVVISDTDIKAYQDAEIADGEAVSIYKGVDRSIYTSNSVALTSDALRENAMSTAVENSPYEVPVWLHVMMYLSAAATAGFVASAVAKIDATSKIRMISTELSRFNRAYEAVEYGETELYEFSFKTRYIGVLRGSEAVEYQGQLVKDLAQAREYYAAPNAVCNKLMLGFGIATIILVGLTTYFTWQDIKNHYKVDFTPIPSHIVDEKDLIGYNSKGEKVILKNQAAYYKAVTCNRAENDGNYKMLADYADMNGDVGSQWLALYTAKNEAEDPILANSFKVVVNSDEIPAGYTTGIHMFGSVAAQNLNSNLYDWNSSAPKVYVYFKVDDSASTTGSNLTAGTLALTGGAGILLGAVVTAFGMNTSRKRKENKTVAV